MKKIVVLAIIFLGVATVVLYAKGWTHVITARFDDWAVEKSMRACSQTDAAKREQCLNRAIRRATAWYGVEAALGGVGTVFAQDQASGQLCHDLTHAIGQEAYRTYARGGRFPISPKTAYCSYGFFHGVSEALVAATGDVREVRKFCDYVLQESDLKGPDPEYQCYHGLGHGTVNPHDQALWGDPVAIAMPAIALCRQVAQTPNQLESCGTGIFAGMAIFFKQGDYGLSIKRNDPFWFCREVPSDFREVCFSEFHSVATVAADGDWRRAVSYIEAIPEDAYATAAMRTKGIDLLQFMQGRDDYREGLAQCRSVQTRLQQACIQDFVRQIWQDSKPGEEFDNMFRFCSSSQVTPEERVPCWKHAFGYLRMYEVGEQGSVCSRLTDPEYQKACDEHVALSN